MYLKEKEAIKITLSALDTAVKQETKELQRIKSEQSTARTELATLTKSAKLIEQKEALKPAPETLWEEWTREDLINDSRTSVTEANNFLNFLDEEYQRAEECVQAIKNNIASNKQALSELHPLTRLRKDLRHLFAEIKHESSSERFKDGSTVPDLKTATFMIAFGGAVVTGLSGTVITECSSAGLHGCIAPAAGASILAALVALFVYFLHKFNCPRATHALAWMLSYAAPVWAITGMQFHLNIEYAKQITNDAIWVEAFAREYFDLIDGNNDGTITQDEVQSVHQLRKPLAIFLLQANPDWRSDLALLNKYLPEMGQHNKFVGAEVANPTVFAGQAVKNATPETEKIKLLYGATIDDVLSFERRMHEKYDKWLP